MYLVSKNIVYDYKIEKEIECIDKNIIIFMSIKLVGT